MTKELKTRRQLETLIMQAAANSGKRADLESVCVVGPFPPSFGDWQLGAFKAKGNATALSPECETELAAIVLRLRQGCYLEGD
jgi:hypothetical protein